MGKINDVDRVCAESAICAGALQDIAEHKLHFHEGVIPAICPDAAQPGMKRHLRSLVTKQNGEERSHDSGFVHGGALVLSPTSPLSTPRPFIPGFLSDLPNKWYKRFTPLFVFLAGFLRLNILLIIFIWAGIKMKGIRSIALYVHAPCGAAQLCGLSFYDEIRHLLLAKKYVRSWLGHLDIKIWCFVHINYGDKERTYYVNVQRATEWLAGVQQEVRLSA